MCKSSLLVLILVWETGGQKSQQMSTTMVFSHVHIFCSVRCFSNFDVLDRSIDREFDGRLETCSTSSSSSPSSSPSSPSSSSSSSATNTWQTHLHHLETKIENVCYHTGAIIACAHQSMSGRERNMANLSPKRDEPPTPSLREAETLKVNTPPRGNMAT